MAESVTRSRWFIAVLATTAAAAVTAGGIYWWNSKTGPTNDDPPDPYASQPKDYPVPAHSKSRYLNTGSDARYIGSDACAVCHAANHRSYLQTAHSRALSDVDPKAEPPDGSFEHKLSGRSYRVVRKDGQIWHEEVLHG